MRALALCRANPAVRSLSLLQPQCKACGSQAALLLLISLLSYCRLNAQTAGSDTGADAKQSESYRARMLGPGELSAEDPASRTSNQGWQHAVQGEESRAGHEVSIVPALR